MSRVRTFFKKAGIAMPKIAPASVDGGANKPGHSDADGEVVLDIEVAGAIAPGARIVVYFAPNTTNGFIDAFWDVVYAGMMGLLAVSLATGALEHYRSGQTTMLLQLIVWPALALCTLLCFLLAFTALATAAARVRGRS